MTIRVYIVKNRSGRQATIDLVPALNGEAIVVEKQAYVFGGPFALGGDNDANLAMIVAGNATTPPVAGHFESAPALKDPWPAKADQKVTIPPGLLPAPLNGDAFMRGLADAPRAPSANYKVFSVRGRTPGAPGPTIDLTGKAAFVWYGQMLLQGSSPVVLVTTGALELSAVVSPAEVDVREIDVSSRATSMPLPEPAFDMRVGPFSRAASVRPTHAEGRAP
jgi:hypothetical protein